MRSGVLLTSRSAKMKKVILVTFLTICAAFFVPGVVFYDKPLGDTSPDSLGLGPLLRPIAYFLSIFGGGFIILPLFLRVELAIARKNGWPKPATEIVDALFKIWPTLRRDTKNDFSYARHSQPPTDEDEKGAERHDENQHGLVHGIGIVRTSKLEHD